MNQSGLGPETRRYRNVKQEIRLVCKRTVSFPFEQKNRSSSGLLSGLASLSHALSYITFLFLDYITFLFLHNIFIFIV